MMTDLWGLGYTRHGDGLAVHYPRAGGGYGAAMPFDHRPELRRSPSSARTALWTAMLSTVATVQTESAENPGVIHGAPATIATPETVPTTSEGDE